MNEFIRYLKNTEEQANPYRGLRGHTAWTAISKTVRNNNGSLDFENGAVDYGNGFAPAGFMLSEDGHCYLRGAVSAVLEGTVICTLPPMVRPEFKQRFVCPTNNPLIFATLEIGTDGKVTLVGYGG